MLLNYKFARHFLPGFHSDNLKNDMKLGKWWGDVNIVTNICIERANDMSKKKCGRHLFAQVLVP